jgi:hypothetical protein
MLVSFSAPLQVRAVRFAVKSQAGDAGCRQQRIQGSRLSALLTPDVKRVIRHAVTEISMRGLLMALFAFDFPGHDSDRAGRERASPRSTKTTAKATTKTV